MCLHPCVASTEQERTIIFLRLDELVGQLPYLSCASVSINYWFSGQNIIARMQKRALRSRFCGFFAALLVYWHQYMTRLRVYLRFRPDHIPFEGLKAC